MPSADRTPQEINAGSMADIAFLLLVFFLVTTTLDSDWGLNRTLPPAINPDDPPPPPIKDRNVFVVLVNFNNDLLVEKKPMQIVELKDAAKEFIVNPRNAIDLPEKRNIQRGKCDQAIADLKQKMIDEPESIKLWKSEMKLWEKRLKVLDILGLETYEESKQVISLRNDRGTSYDTYIQVQNELARAYKEVRQEVAQKYFSEDWDFILEKKEEDPTYADKADVILTLYPSRISEAEPENIGK